MKLIFEYKSILIILISFFVFLVYIPSFTGGFQHDDIANLTANPELKIESLSFDSIQQASMSSDAGLLKRPLSMLTFGLNYFVFGDEPISFKVINTIIHIINSILVFFVISRLKTINNKNSPRSLVTNHYFIFASICAFIWAIHPIQVSTTAYIIQRMTLLATLFSLTSILFFLNFRHLLVTKKKFSNLNAIFCLTSICAGILCKENAILTFPLLVAIELIVIQPLLEKNDSLKFTRNTLTKLFILALIIFIPLLYLLLDYYSYETLRTREFTLHERFLTQFRVISLYIKWFLIPNITEMGLHHDDIAISTSLLNPISTLFGFLFLFGLLLLGLLLIKFLPLASLGIAWFFIGHLLESTIIPLELSYEHRNYLPTIGLVLAIAEIVRHLSKRLIDSKRMKFTILGAIIVALYFTSFIRTSQWSDPLNFAFYEAKHHPNSVRANHALGMIYRQLTLEGKMEYKDAAYRHLATASTLPSRHIQPEVALIKLSFELNENASPEWISNMARKLKTSAPKLDHALLVKEIVLCRNNSCVLQEDAAKYILEASLSNPRLHSAPLAYSTLHSISGNFIMERHNNISDAEKHFTKAIEISPHQVQHYVDYVNLLVLAGRKTEALKILKLAETADSRKLHTRALDDLRKIVDKHANNKT